MTKSIDNRVQQIKKELEVYQKGQSRQCPVFDELYNDVFKCSENIIKKNYQALNYRAKDVIHDCFIKFFLNIDTLQPENLKGWFLKIIKNKCIDELRRLKRHQKWNVGEGDSFDLYKEIIGEIDDNMSHLFDELTWHMRFKLEQVSFEEALEALKNDKALEWNVLILYYGFGVLKCQHKTIAEKLGISEHMSKKHLKAAKDVIERNFLSKFNID